MEFIQYAEIENSYRQGFLEKIKDAGHDFDSLKCSVTEKLHGSNFSIWFDGTDVKFAKRTSFLDVDDDFFNWQDVIERGNFKEKIKSIFEIVRAKENVVLFGELCGGVYTHPDVEKSKDKKVQKGVHYSPYQQFVAFDLKIDNFYMDPPEFYSLMEKLKIVHVPVLFEGTLSECLDYPNDGNSVLYKSFDLPEIEKNMMEGVVIKPDKTFYMGLERLVLKNKNEKHKEKEKTKKVKKPIEFSDEEKVFLEKLISYLNENRVRAVISKIGTVKQNDFSKLMGMVSGDCVKEFTKENEDFNQLEKSNQKKITQLFMKNYVAKLIRKNFLNIIDGLF